MKNLALASMAGTSLAVAVVVGTARSASPSQTSTTPTASPTSTVTPAPTATLTSTVAPTATATVSSLQPPPPPPPPGATFPPLTPPCPPTGCATSTPTVTPTATVTPTFTPTPVPLVVAVKLAHSKVSPQSKQKVSVTTAAGAQVSIKVSFPNGDGKVHAATANASGKLSWSFVQPGSRITRYSRTARVSASASSGSQQKSASKKYSINFARLDISATPRKQKRGSPVSLWVHTNARTRVTVDLQFNKKVHVSINGITGTDGWAYSRYTLPKNAPKGRVDVKAHAAPKHVAVSGETSFRVK